MLHMSIVNDTAGDAVQELLHVKMENVYAFTCYHLEKAKTNSFMIKTTKGAYVNLYKTHLYRQ